MYLLLLAGFSNYNNRTIRKTTTPDLYSSLAESYWYITKDNQLLDINFKPNDGVATTQVINSSLYSEFGHAPDYLIAFENADTSKQSIVSRWFIMEIRQNRGGQYELILRRDLIADYYDGLKTADIFVERGLCDNEDPLIFNDEGMNLNKIKKGETILKDETNCAWIVGYMDGENASTIQVENAEATDYLTPAQAASATGLTESQIISLIQGNPLPTATLWRFVWNNRRGTEIRGNTSRFSPVIEEEQTSYHSRISGINVLGTLSNMSFQQIAEAYANALENNANSVLARFKTITGITATYDCIEKLINLAKPIKHDNVVYVIDEVIKENGRSPETTSTDSGIKSILTTEGIPIEGDGQFIVKPTVWDFRIRVSVSETYNLTISMGGASVPYIPNRPYKMFCFPLGSFRAVSNYPTPLDPYPTFQDIDPLYMKKILSAIMVQAGDSTELGIYDIQLLPYCPIRELINGFGLPIQNNFNIVMEGLVSGEDYAVLKDGSNNTKGYVFYCRSDQASLVINASFGVDSNPKYDSNAKMLRLCSPNYQGSFDFNAAKNGGVQSFNVFFTYKPYTPFIKVAPNFDLLYGTEFVDQRGLICGGNFSIAQTTSAWAQYELNNKNYQNIFNREIQSLDLRQSIEMRNQMFAAGSGTISGAVGGAQAGFAMGGGWGAVAGAVAGGGLSLAGGIIDTNNLALLQKDERSLQVDKYLYSLGNIKALPNTLTKIDAFDITSKIWPFVEEYGPTNEEKALFEERMRLQSYTIMRIEKLGNQMTEGAPTDISQLHYVKGQLIRTDNDDLRVDAHEWDEMYAELAKGVYI